MAISLSITNWFELWDQSRQHAHQADPDDAGDRIAVGPSKFVTGYKRDIILRNGIDLTLHRYALHDDLALTQMQPEDTGCLEFIFNLSSTFKYWQGPYLAAEYLIQAAKKYSYI